MSAENKALVRQLTEHLVNKQVDSAAKLLHPEFMYNAPGFPQLRGPKEWAALMGAFYANSPNLQFKVQEQIGEGNSVATHLVWTTVHEREFMGMPPTGLKLSMSSVAIHHVRDGKVVAQWVYDDYLGLFKQLGAIPTGLVQQRMDVPGGLGERSVEVLVPGRG